MIGVVSERVNLVGHEVKSGTFRGRWLRVLFLGLLGSRSSLLGFCGLAAMGSSSFAGQ